jgi:hypothetical protein
MKCKVLGLPLLLKVQSSQKIFGLVSNSRKTAPLRKSLIRPVPLIQPFLSRQYMRERDILQYNTVVFNHFFTQNVKQTVLKDTGCKTGEFGPVVILLTYLITCTLHKI